MANTRVRELKTHCPKGHPYSGDNLLMDGTKRKCRTCVRENAKRRYHAMMAVRPPLPPPPPRRRLDPEVRFWAKVLKTDTCWLWTGATIGGCEYGKMFFGERGQLIPAHRFSYMIHKGPIPPGLVIDHKCDVQRCVNPDHLQAVSQGKNLQFAYDRGRRNPLPKRANGQFKRKDEP